LIRKLAIVGAILVVAGVLLYPQLEKLGNPTVDAITQDLGGLKDATAKRASYEIDKAQDTVGDKLDQTKDVVGKKIDNVVPDVNQLNPIPKIQDQLAVPPMKQTYYGQVYEKNDSDQTCKVSVPKMAKTVNGVKELTHTITIQDCKYEKNKPVQITTTTDPLTNTQTVSVDQIPQSKIFETLQLTTTRNADNTVSIHYSDTSGKTLKVIVTLRNSDKQLFSGEFFASSFDTSVNDVSSSPHIIEMTVEHADYGTVSSSVYNPQGNDQSTIYGVFTQ